MRHTAQSFPPIVTRNSRTLILGSMPGVKSLAQGEYYAHPQNSFWKILSALYKSPIGSYAQRVSIIKKNGLALWDVLECCERFGSLDGGIDDATIKPNDFPHFFQAHPKITRLFFNGAKAEHEFMKRVWPHLPREAVFRISLDRLPSTSPANAGTSPAAKLEAWRRILAE